jgi:hypothetical protein
VKWKNAKEVQQGCETAERMFVHMAKHASKYAMQHLAKYRASERYDEWNHLHYLQHRAKRRQWMTAAKELRKRTRVGYVDVVGERIWARDERERRERRALAA